LLPFRTLGRSKRGAWLENKKGNNLTIKQGGMGESHLLHLSRQQLIRIKIEKKVSHFRKTRGLENKSGIVEAKRKKQKWS